MVLQQQGKLSEGTQHFAVKSIVTAGKVSVVLIQPLKLIYEPFFHFIDKSLGLIRLQELISKLIKARTGVVREAHMQNFVSAAALSSSPFLLS